MNSESMASMASPSREAKALPSDPSTSLRYRSRGVVRTACASLLGAALLVAAGCTTQTRDLVDATGRQWRCEQTGWGGIGMRQARQGVGICRDAMMALGYLDRDKAGEIGVLELVEGPTNPIIARVSPGSPVARQGIADGAMLISVDGRRVRDAVSARDLLFGSIGTSTSIVVLQGVDTLTYVVPREQEVVQENGLRYWPGAPVAAVTPSADGPASAVPASVDGAPAADVPPPAVPPPAVVPAASTDSPATVVPPVQVPGGQDPQLVNPPEGGR